MNADRNNLNPHFDGLDPLPAEFESELTEIDHLLSRATQLNASDAPTGLSQRVFEMSVSSLPSAKPALRLVETETQVVTSPRRYVFNAWARLALAASVLLVAGVMLWTTWPHTTQPIASNAKDGNGTRLVNASIDLGDLNSLDAANPSAIDAFENEFAYLLDASEVRSYNDLNDDLILLVQNLEM